MKDEEIMSSESQSTRIRSRGSNLFVTLIISLLAVISVSSDLFMGSIILKRVSIGNERSQLVDVYGANTLKNGIMFSYLAGQPVDANTWTFRAQDLVNAVKREIQLRPATVSEIPNLQNEVGQTLQDIKQIDVLMPVSSNQALINDVINKNLFINQELLQLNTAINGELTSLTHQFYWALALVLTSLLFLFYVLVLMRSSIAKISKLTSTVISSLKKGDLSEKSASQIIEPTRLLPGSELVVSETMKLADMYQSALATERKLFEEQKGLTTELESTNKELIAAKEETFRAAQLSAIGKVAGSVSHEINNPITGILGYIAYVRKKTTDEELVKYLDKARKEVERVGRIAKSLLVFSRHNATLPSAKFELAGTIENIAVLVAPQLRDALTDLDVAPLSDLPAVMGRVDEYQQCLLNLIINARDALKDCPEKKIWISAKIRDKMIDLYVTDSGKGVPQDFREFLFQPFHTTKPAGEGSGLGLSVCRELMNRMGGEASFDPTYGPGARFVLSIPIYVEPAPQA